MFGKQSRRRNQLSTTWARAVCTDQPTLSGVSSNKSFEMRNQIVESLGHQRKFAKGCRFQIGAQVRSATRFTSRPWELPMCDFLILRNRWCVFTRLLSSSDPTARIPRC